MGSTEGMSYARFAVPVSQVLEDRRRTRRAMRNAGWVGVLVGTVLDVCTWFPLLVLARLGLLRGRSREGGGGPGGGDAAAGDRARLPKIPPQLGAGAAKEIPRD